uniref:Glycine rich extracellular protein 1 n=1 Tax=Rattus norvegicus TaxID=10116 RepID=A0A8I6A9U7_RAT
MGIWVFPIALFLLCLTSESLQGGLPRLPPNLGKGYSPSGGLGTVFGGDAKPLKSGSLSQNGYGTGVGGGMEPPKPGFGVAVKPQKSGYGLGLRVFPGVGAQPGPPTQNGHGPGTSESMKSPKPGFSNGNGIGAEALPGVGAQPGLGAGAKPQKAGFGNGNTLGAQPGFGGVGKAQKPGLGNGNEQGVGTIPGTGAQPDLGGGLRPQKPGYEAVKSQKSGFGNRSGFGLGAQPGPPAQNGHGPGTSEGMKPPKPGFSNGNGIGAEALPGVGAQPGFREGRKPQKPGYGNKNGLDALPGYGTDLKTQKPGSWNGHGLGVQLGYRNGLGPRTFQGQGLRPGYRLGIPLGYNLGNGVAAQPGSCNGGIAPPQFLPGPPTTVPSDKGGGWGLKSQLPPPVQNAPTPAIQWGPKPQKAGYQPSDGYGAGAQLGFHGGLKLQKVGFHYGNAALEAGILPEILQSGFPTANGFSNGLREETLLYPKATVPTLERHGKVVVVVTTITTTTTQQGQAGAFQPWGAGVKPEYGYAGLGIQTGPYGQLRPELRLEHLGDPELKTYTKSPLGNGYRGHCPSGEC